LFAGIFFGVFVVTQETNAQVPGRGMGFLKGFPKRININLPLVGFLHRNKYEQKTSEQKLSSTMAEPFAGSSGTAVATYTKPSR
jgi:hypothetical protein